MSADQVAHGRRVRARVAQWKIADSGIEATRHLRELGEIDRLGARRQRARRIPFDPARPANVSSVTGLVAPKSSTVVWSPGEWEGSEAMMHVLCCKK